MKVQYFPVFTDNFKFNSFTVNFLLPLNEKNATLSALLAQVLKRGCQKYGEMDRIVARMEELYGASISISSDKIGENLTFMIRGSFLDNRFAVNDEDICGGVLDVMSEMLLRPFTENGTFRSDYFAQEKQNQADFIRSLVNDKRTYAMMRCKEIMFADRAYRFTSNGTLNCLENVTNRDLYEFYRNMLADTSVLVTYIGRNLDIEKVFDRHFAVLTKGNTTTPVQRVICAPSDLKTVDEAFDVAQGKLCLGFRFDASVDAYAARLFNVIYGGSPTSKLFMNVRERLSLCYYCSSGVDLTVGGMFVSSGIEFANYEVAKAEIMNQLNDMKNGNITDEEFENGKAYLLDYIAGIKDSHGALLSDILSRYILGLPEEISEQITKIQSLTKRDIIDVASHVIPDTVYFLKGSEC